MEVCRVCLAMNVRMYDISEHQLKAMYKRVTGIEITEDNFPQELCWECFGRLSSANRFIQKALKTQLILSKKVTDSRLITISDIDSIDKAQHKLESTLGIKFFNVNEYDFLFSGETVELNNSGNISIDQSANQIYYEVSIKIEPDDEEEEINKECITEEGPIVTDEVHNYITTNDGAERDDVESKTYVNNANFSNQEVPICVKVEYTNDKEVSADDESQRSLERRLVDKKELTVAMKGKSNTQDTPNADQSTTLIQRLKMRSELCTPIENNTFIQGDLEMDTGMSSSCTDSIKVPQCKKSFVNALGGSNDQINAYLSTLSMAQKKSRIILTRDDYPQKLFICDICNKSFKHKPTLILHIQKHPKMHYCTYCSYRSYLKSHLRTHVNAKHIKSEVFNCPYCTYTANQKVHLSVHINAKHTKSEIFNCPHCSYKAYRNEHLLRHLNAKHTASDILNCPYCKYKSSRECNLELHIKVKHTESDFLSCPHCSYKTHRKPLLLRHVNAVHSKKEVFKCPHCIYKSFRKNTLENHVNAKHTKSDFISCPYCSYKTYHISTGLAKHLSNKHAQC